MRAHFCFAAALAPLALVTAYVPSVLANEAGPTYAADGLVHVPPFDLPPSVFLSKEGVDLLKTRPVGRQKPYAPGGDIAKLRSNMEQSLVVRIRDLRARYAVDIVEQTIGGVKTRIVTPKAKPIDTKSVLINLHGGGFMMCAEGCAILESVPIAALGGFKVISVDYRQAPEFVFPAANEDVASVYHELLKTYEAKRIGMYGCSAGGMLTGQVAAWLVSNKQPMPGALGIFGAGAGAVDGGDSRYLSPYIDGGFPPPGTPPPPQSIRSYFEGADMSDPLLSPMMHLDLLAKFPPTLVITSTRAIDLSPAIFTHSQLLKAGVSSNLLVGEGLRHCYMYFPDLPEAQDAYRVIVEFFKKNLN